MRPIAYSIVTTAALYAVGVSIDAVLTACAVIFAALATGTAYMNRDELARSATRYAFRVARRFERGSAPRRAMFRAARKVEAYARKAEAEIRADGIA